MNVKVTTGRRAVSYNSGITNCSVHCVFMMPCACMYSRQNSKTHFSLFKNQDTRLILIHCTLVEKTQICKIRRRAEDNGNWVIKQVTHRTCSATSMVFCNFFNKSRNFFWCQNLINPELRNNLCKIQVLPDFPALSKTFRFWVKLCLEIMNNINQNAFAL